MIERQTKSQIPYQCGPFSRIIQSFVSQIQITCKEALPSCMPKMIIFYLWICSLSSAKPFGCRKSWQVGLSFQKPEQLVNEKRVKVDFCIIQSILYDLASHFVINGFLFFVNSSLILSFYDQLTLRICRVFENSESKIITDYSLLINYRQ